MNRGFPCYTTKTGLRIGALYDPPAMSFMTPEAELVQRAYLNRGQRFQSPMTQTLMYAGSAIAGVLALALLVRGVIA